MLFLDDANLHPGALIHEIFHGILGPAHGGDDPQQSVFEYGCGKKMGLDAQEAVFLGWPITQPIDSSINQAV